MKRVNNSLRRAQNKSFLLGGKTKSITVHMSEAQMKKLMEFCKLDYGTHPETICRKAIGEWVEQELAKKQV